MQHQHPLHGSVWARQLVEHIGQQGGSVGTLLHRVGLHPRFLNAEDSKLPADKVVTIFELAAEISGDDSVGFHFGQTREPRDGGLLTYVGLSSPTVGDCLANIARYSRVFTEATVVDVSRLSSDGHFDWHWRLPSSIKRRQYVEWSASALIHMLRLLSRRTIRPAGIRFKHSRNSGIPEFERYFGCPLDFGSQVNRIDFKLDDLQAPLFTADSRLHKILRDHCELVLQNSRDGEEDLAGRVERLIADRLPMGEATLENVATALGMSKRTLSRRLAEHGSSFKDILDAYRRSIALEYLQNDNLSMIQIAYLLGYTEVSSLNHACKRWEGRTPSELRRNG